MRSSRSQDQPLTLRLQRRHLILLGSGGLLSLALAFGLGFGLGRQEGTGGQASALREGDASVPGLSLAYASALPHALRDESEDPSGEASGGALAEQGRPVDLGLAGSPSEPDSLPDVGQLEGQAEAALARLRQAQGATEPPPESASPAAAAPEGEGAASGSGARGRAAAARYTLQVSAFQDREEALALVRRLRSHGYNPYLTATELSGRGRFVRVRVGKFASREAADAFRQRFEQQEGLSSYVSPMEPPGPPRR